MKELSYFEICSCAKKIELSSQANADILLCPKKVGRKLPHSIPFLQDGEVCYATRFNLKSKHVIPETKIVINKMYECAHRENCGKEITQHELFENMFL